MKSVVTLMLVAALAPPAVHAQEGTLLFADGIAGWTTLNTAEDSFSYSEGVLREF